MKLEIILPISLAILIVATGYFFLSDNSRLGAAMIQQSSYFGATSAGFECPATATTTSPVLSLNNTRTGFRVFNRSAQPMFIHINAQATTTGVAVNSGAMLSPYGNTTSSQTYLDFYGAKGYVYCISPVAASGTVISWK